MLDDAASLAIKEQPDGHDALRSIRRRSRADSPTALEVRIPSRTPCPTSPAEITWFSERARPSRRAGSGRHAPISGASATFPAFHQTVERSPTSTDSLARILKDVASGKVLRAYETEPNWRIVDLAYTPDGRYLVIGGFHSQIHVWRLRPDLIRAHENEVWSLAFSPDGASLASASDDHTVKLWEIDTAREASHFARAPVVRDGGRLLSRRCDCWLPPALTRRFAFPTRRPEITSRRFAAIPIACEHSPSRPTGRRSPRLGMTTSCDSGTFKQSASIRPPLTGHTDRVYALAFAPDGKTLFSGSSDQTVRLWDWRAHRARAVLHADDQVYSLAISPDGLTLATAQPGGKVVLWDVERKQPRSSLRGHSGDVLGLAFSPDGLTLASTGRDKMVRLWDPLTSQQLLTLQGHDAAVAAVAFSRDGSVLATGSHDGKIKLWRASSGDKPEPSFAQNTTESRQAR